MRDFIKLAVGAFLAFVALSGAETIGFLRGAESVEPEPLPNLATTLCYQMGQELSELSPSADIAMVRARAQAVCVRETKP